MKAFNQHEVSFHAVGSGEHQGVTVSGQARSGSPIGQTTRNIGDLRDFACG